jgi:asparagine synthase (glutamine-hydrolysing)
LLGTHLICDLRRGLNFAGTDLPQGLESIGLPGFSQRLVWQDKLTHLSCTISAHYPVAAWENKDLLIHLEGRLYHLEEAKLAAELFSLAHRVFTAHKDPRPHLARWVREADGDFLLVMVHKTDGRIAVINDVFGRLPTYFHLREGVLILSRDLRLVTRVLGAADFDRMALAQYLLLGFPLGKRTWFAAIQALERASLVMIDPRCSSIQVDRLHEFNLEGEEHRQSPAENARNLASRFRGACRVRATGNGPHLVSLSGGLDSRAVAAGLWREKIPFDAATFLNAQQTNAADVRAAAQVAEILGVNWQSFHLPPPRGKDLVRLLNLKSGTNDLRMSFILPFFQLLLEKFGPGLTYFTGDGGGDTLRDSRPYRRLRTPEALLEYVIERDQVWPLDRVAALTGLAGNEIKAELFERLASYPEKSPEWQYRHFSCLEMVTKMYNEGEDRNRQFFWSVTPFYSPDFFTYAMSCPDRDKGECRFYQEFLTELHPGVAQVDYANWQAPLASLKFALLYRLKGLTRRRPEMVRRLRKLMGYYDRVGPTSRMLACLREQSTGCPAIPHYLDPRALREVLSRPQDFDKLQLWTLFTLTSTLADYTGDHAIGAAYLESDID